MTKYVVYNYQSQWPRGFKWFPSPEGVDEKLFTSASQILSNFSLVGRTEDLGTFVRKLNVVLGWPEEQKAERENTTPAENHYELGTDEVAKLQQYNVLDNKLYKQFCVGSSKSVCAARAAKPVGSNPTLLNGIIDLPWLEQQGGEQQDDDRMMTGKGSSSRVSRLRSAGKEPASESAGLSLGRLLILSGRRK